MMPAVIRLGDTTTGHQPTNNPHGPRSLITTGQMATRTVYANGRKIAARGDKLAPTHVPPADPNSDTPANKINGGSGNVFVNGFAVARVGDVTCGESTVAGTMGFSAGSNNVYVNGD